ncbi:pentapeptide repeat-containing protein [Lentzea sp. NPDC006480]|uniref:pentapeptide repeat-containing protein n=1 Tax=Lentzea sp. NPDC006480 TaxID=3157176 RepID=UPI0033BBB6AB
MADPGPRPLTTRAIVLGGLAVLAVGGLMLTLLLTLYGGGSPQDQAHLDAVRTAGTIVVGTGGAVALLLAARRQRSAELTLKHQQETARQAEHDAIERRITDLYTKAADQLGSDKAPVRLAGLYALERLGVANAEQRRTIINVICAYLRMPFVDDREEAQVRITALRILHAHRRGDQHFWSVSIDLDGANLAGSRLPRSKFAWATFEGADLSRVDFTGSDLSNADLTHATLVDADFTGVDLSGARLDHADLTGIVLKDAVWNEETVWPGPGGPPVS